MAVEPMHILVVHDDVLFLTKIIFVATSLGATVRTVRTYDSALALLRAEPFSCILCQVTSTESDGMRVIHVAKAAHPGLAVIAVADFSGGDDLAGQASAAGADTVLFNPVDPDALSIALAWARVGGAAVQVAEPGDGQT